MRHTLDPSAKTLTLAFPGDVLSTGIDSLTPTIFGILESSKPDSWNVLVLDLKAAKMVDSAGLNLIISVVRSVQPRGVKIRALIANQNILRTFKFTRLDRHIELVQA